MVYAKMGKGIIQAPLGDGKYSVKLDLDTRRIEERRTKIDADLTAILGQIQTAQQELNAAREVMEQAAAELDEAIREWNEGFTEIKQQIGTLEEEIQAAKTHVENAQSWLDALKAAEEEGVEHLEEAIAAAEEDLAAKQKIAADLEKSLAETRQRLIDRQGEYTQLTEQAEKLAPLTADYQTKLRRLQELKLRQAAWIKEKAQLESRQPEDPTLEAWCADLSLELEGTVGTIEIPGERKAVPVLIRPGFEGRAEYRSTEQHANLIQAVSDARGTLRKAEFGLGAAEYVLREAGRHVEQAQARLYDLLNAPEPNPAMIDSARMQVSVAEGSAEMAQAAVELAETRLTEQRGFLQQKIQALEAARTTEPHPRLGDGQLTPVSPASGPFGTFYNWALLPAIQRYRPMYRLAVITALDGDDCDVSLDPALSSQQSININSLPNLSHIRIEYMECNGAAFALGDRVVVEFDYRNIEKPKVIGFEREPKACRKFNCYMIELAARATGGANVAPLRIGFQAWNPPAPPDDAPIPPQPPSAYAPWGYWPADSAAVADPKKREYVAVGGIYPAEGEPIWKTTWRAKDSVTGVAWNNRRFHAWDGAAYLGCLSWLGKICFGGEYHVRPQNWAGPVIRYGQPIPPRTPDLMMDLQQTNGTGNYDLVWQGRVILNIQSIPGAPDHRDKRIVAACLVQHPATTGEGGAVIPEWWAVRFVVCFYNEYGPIYDEDYYRKYHRMVPRPGWPPFLQAYCRPENAWFQVYEAPLDAINNADRLSRTLPLGSVFHVPEDFWLPNFLDFERYNLDYIDASAAMRPEIPIGAFSQSGAKCTILAYGAVEMALEGGRGMANAVASLRLEFSDAAPSMTAILDYGHYQMAGAVSYEYYYDEDANQIRFTGTPHIFQSSSSAWGSWPLAVEFDGEQEILGILEYSKNESSSGYSDTISVPGGSSSQKTSLTQISLHSTNGKIDLDWQESEIENNAGSGQDQSVCYIDLWMGFQYLDLIRGNYCFLRYTNIFAQSGSIYSAPSAEQTRDIAMIWNGEELFHDSCVIPTRRQDFADDLSGDFVPFAPSSDVSSAGIDLGYGIADAYLELHHYGKSPVSAFAQDHHGNTLAYFGWNEWAPFESYAGYRTSGGFVPNTTHHRFFWTAGDLTEQIQVEKLTGLDWTVKSLGFI